MKEPTVTLANKIVIALNNLNRMVQEDTTDAVATKNPIELVRHFYDVRTTADAIKEAREKLDEMEKRLSREFIPDLFRELGVKTMTVEGVGRVSLSNRWSASIIDKPAGFEWLRSTGNGALIIETVNAQTLASFAREYNEEKGKELPADIFKTGIMTVTSITKA